MKNYEYRQWLDIIGVEDNTEALIIPITAVIISSLDLNRVGKKFVFFDHLTRLSEEDHSIFFGELLIFYIYIVRNVCLSRWIYEKTFNAIKTMIFNKARGIMCLPDILELETLLKLRIIQYDKIIDIKNDISPLWFLCKKVASYLVRYKPDYLLETVLVFNIYMDIYFSAAERIDNIFCI